MSEVLPAEKIVQLTEGAASYVRELREKEEDGQDKCLRLYVENGGCSGLQYGMVFDENREGDFSDEVHGIRVVVDAFSANYLKGTILDFVDSLTGGGFKITNPNARTSCGCGKSFEA